MGENIFSSLDYKREQIERLWDDPDAEERIVLLDELRGEFSDIDIEQALADNYNVCLMYRQFYLVKDDLKNDPVVDDYHTRVNANPPEKLFLDDRYLDPQYVSLFERINKISVDDLLRAFKTRREIAAEFGSPANISFDEMCKLARFKIWELNKTKIKCVLLRLRYCFWFPLSSLKDNHKEFFGDGDNESFLYLIEQGYSYEKLIHLDIDPNMEKFIFENFPDDLDAQENAREIIRLDKEKKLMNFIRCIRNSRPVYDMQNLKIILSQNHDAVKKLLDDKFIPNILFGFSLDDLKQNRSAEIVERIEIKLLEASFFEDFKDRFESEARDKFAIEYKERQTNENKGRPFFSQLPTSIPRARNDFSKFAEPHESEFMSNYRHPDLEDLLDIAYEKVFNSKVVTNPEFYKEGLGLESEENAELKANLEAYDAWLRNRSNPIPNGMTIVADILAMDYLDESKVKDFKAKNKVNIESFLCLHGMIRKFGNMKDLKLTPENIIYIASLQLKYEAISDNQIKALLFCRVKIQSYKISFDSLTQADYFNHPYMRDTLYLIERGYTYQQLSDLNFYQSTKDAVQFERFIIDNFNTEDERKNARMVLSLETNRLWFTVLENSSDAKNLSDDQKRLKQNLMTILSQPHDSIAQNNLLNPKASRDGYWFGKFSYRSLLDRDCSKEIRDSVEDPISLTPLYTKKLVEYVTQNTKLALPSDLLKNERWTTRFAHWWRRNITRRHPVPNKLINADRKTQKYALQHDENITNLVKAAVLNSSGEESICEAQAMPPQGKELAQIKEQRKSERPQWITRLLDGVDYGFKHKKTQEPEIKFAAQTFHDVKGNE